MFWPTLKPALVYAAQAAATPYGKLPITVGQACRCAQDVRESGYDPEA